jgi:hypothetical protein
MKEQTISIPSFKLSQLKDPAGTLTPEKALDENLQAIMKNFYETYPDGDMLVVCAREKLSDGDYLFGLACIPSSTYDVDMISVILDRFHKIPNIFINAKRDVIETVKKVLKNLIFS